MKLREDRNKIKLSFQKKKKEKRFTNIFFIADFNIKLKLNV